MMTRSMSAWMVCYFVFGFSSAAAAAPGDEFLGRWVSNDFDGIQTWESGACAAVLFTTRHYTFQRRPNSDEIFGSYFNEKQARYFRNHHQKCLLAWQKTPGPVAAQIRSWSIDTAVLSSDALSFATTYAACRLPSAGGDTSCTADAQVSPGSFSARVVASAPYLFDLGNPDKTELKIVYHDENKLQSDLGPAQEAFNEMVAAMASASAEDFLDRYQSSLFPHDRQSALRVIRSLKTSMSHIVSRDLIEGHFFDQANVSGEYRMQRGAVLIYEAKIETGVSALETVVLFEEQDGWKLGLLEWGL